MSDSTEEGGEGGIVSRLEALETKSSYQERAIAELSAELFEERKRSDRLEKLLRELGGKVKELLDAAEPSAPGDVRPPHW